MAPKLQLRRPDKKPYPAHYLYFKTNMKNKLLLFMSSFLLRTVIMISLLKVLFD